MNEPRTFFNPLRRSLSGRLLIFTVGFVMLAEVLIFTPSIAKFRLDWLDQRLFDAHLAALTLANMPQSPLSAGVEDELLALVGAEYIQVQNDTVGPYRIGVDVVEADEQIDLTNRDPIRLIIEAFATLFRTGPRTLQVQGMSPGDEAVMVYVTLDEAPLREDMYAYSRNILALSIIISLITAGLVFVSLRALLVSPLKQLTNKMVAFRQDPEDPASLEEPSRRQDEVGIAERELRDMQLQLVGALKQKDRLATLGTAVTMINHDLRNMLSAAAIVSEGLDQTEDPKVKRFAPRLMESIDRAVRLCEMTLDYASKGPEATILGEVDLHHVVSEAAEEALLAGDGEGQVINDVPQDLMIQADRDQLFRLFANVLRNAFQAGATEVTVASAIADGQAATDITDNGPGLPPRARDQLFKPFAGSARLGGTGLGLAIAREIALAHKGDLKLVESNAEGTVFRASLPIRQPANGTGRNMPLPGNAAPLSGRIISRSAASSGMTSSAGAGMKPNRR